VRVVLIHGSGGNAETAWTAVRPLAERFTLVTPNRSGYPPNPPLERIDFEVQAAELAPLLEDGALAERLGRAGLARARSEFSVDRMASSTLSVYERALQGR
jgi:glycosyltransferase involved in cell wall biosynthesis